MRSDLLGYRSRLGAQLMSGVGEFHSVGPPIDGIGPPDGESQTLKVIDGAYHRRPVFAGQVHQTALAERAVEIQVEQDSEVPALDAKRLERSAEGPGAVTLRLAQQRAYPGEVFGVFSGHEPQRIRSLGIVPNETIPSDRDGLAGRSADWSGLRGHQADPPSQMQAHEPDRDRSLADR